MRKTQQTSLYLDRLGPFFVGRAAWQSAGCYGAHYVIIRNGYVNTVMENPFVYGEVVPATAFVDREAELDRLVSDLAAGQKVFLISPRRYGKSSLIRQALARGGAGAARSPSRSRSAATAPTWRFSKGYARALLASRRGWERARTWLRDAIASTRPEIRYEPTDAGRSAVRRRVSRRAHRSRRHPARATKCSRCPAGSPTERKRQGGRRARRVPGDRRLQRRQRRARAARRGAASAAGRLRLRRFRAEPDGEDARARSRPFYKAGPVMRLQKIPPTMFADVHRGAVREDAASSRNRASATAIVDLAGNMPYDVQRLAHETWDDVRAGGGRTVDARRPASDARAAAGRAGNDVRGRVAAPHAAAARDAAGGRARREGASSCRPTCARAIGWAAVDGPGVAAGAHSSRTSSRGRCRRYIVVDSLMREWVARKTF